MFFARNEMRNGWGTPAMPHRPPGVRRGRQEQIRRPLKAELRRRGHTPLSKRRRFWWMLRARMMIVQIGCKLMPHCRVGANGALK